MGKQWETLFWGASKSLQMVIAAMKLKDAYSLEGKWKWSRSIVSDLQQPHKLQPARLLHPWDFPGKSTGVGCHCLLHNIHTSALFKILFQYRSLQSTEFPVLFSRTLLVTYFIYCSVYMSVPISQFIHSRSFKLIVNINQWQHSWMKSPIPVIGTVMFN